MEEPAHVLVNHWRSVVTKEGSRLVCTNHKPVFSIAGAWLLGAFGIAASLTMTALFASILVSEGFEPSLLLAPLLGLPFLAVSAFQLRLLQRRWGSVEVDAQAGTIVWRQGNRLRGTWSTNDARRIRNQHAFLVTYRDPLSFSEFLLVADLHNGNTLTLLVGNREERIAVQEALETLLPDLHR